jgi:hypothetical protein
MEPNEAQKSKLRIRASIEALKREYIRTTPQGAMWLEYFDAQIAELDRQLAFDAARAAQAEANAKSTKAEGKK